MPSGIMKIECPICWSILFKAVEYCMQADDDGGSSGTSVIIACTLRLALINNDPYVWLTSIKQCSARHRICCKLLPAAVESVMLQILVAD